MQRKMNAKQERFCQEYIVDLNATQAAIRAGYTENEESAAVQGSRLLSDAKILERVDGLQREAAEAARVTGTFVLSKLVDVTERAMQGVDRELEPGIPPVSITARVSKKTRQHTD
jgi:phage terminase small subunit